MKQYILNVAQTTNEDGQRIRIEWIEPAHKTKGAPRDLEIRVLVDDTIVYKCRNTDAEYLSSEFSIALKESGLELPF